MGFKVLYADNMQHLGFTSYRLRTPRGFTESQALSLLRQKVAGEKFVLNHLYHLASGACSNNRCNSIKLIDWPIPTNKPCLIPARIGIVDTSIDPQTAGLNQRNFNWQRFSNKKSDSEHGTAIAGLLAGNPNKGVPGLLPASIIFAADVFETQGKNKNLSSVESLVRGIDWLLGKNLDVINISVTGPPNELLRAAIDRANALNIPVVAAAGNDGPRAKPDYPAAYYGVIAVTAVDARLRLYRQANRGKYVTISAPGVGVWTPSRQGGKYRNGTSFAAPYVTAVIAALHHGNRQSVKQLHNNLVHHTVDLGPKGRDSLYGLGLIKGSGLCR